VIDRNAPLSSRVRGSLLGGALGDALGAPVEFMSAEQIESAYGPNGVRSFRPAPSGAPTTLAPVGLITDDTQMTLFTVEGIIRALNRMNQRGIGFTNAVLHHAYLRWADTQLHAEPLSTDGWLIQQRWLYSRRAPGQTCLSALAGGTHAVQQFGATAINDSKGCGGVMRSAPFGWLSSGDNHDWIYQQACQSAAFTHGHATGQVASGALAYLIAHIVDGQDLLAALHSTLAFLQGQDNSQETTDALAKAIQLSMHGDISTQTLQSLGGGWIAEEALAIGVYAALSHPDQTTAREALALAVSHSGDSDSTGSICGNILGALWGEAWLPSELVFRLEGRGTMLELADDLIFAWRDGSTPKAEFMNIEDAAQQPDGLLDISAWLDRYPPW
jgi:ADP-ribosylglycohydrolase